MFIKPGVTYRLTFVSGFESLNGLYTVSKLLSHEEMLINEFSILDFYLAVGKTETEFLADKLDYINYDYIKITSITDETKIYYTNALLLQNIPDFSAQPYQQLGIAINIGIYEDENDVIGITNAIKTLLESNYGIVCTPSLFSHNAKQWLTDAQYQAIVDERLAHKTVVVNEHMLLNQLSIENASLRAKIASLESFLLPPVITQVVLDDMDNAVHITFNKSVKRTAGTFFLTGSVTGTIPLSYAAGNNSPILIYTTDTPPVAGETLTLTFVGPGVTGPTVTNNLDNITNVAVINQLT